MTIHIVHHSREARYREPFGSCPTQSDVRLALSVRSEHETIRKVLLRYRYGLYRFDAAAQKLQRTEVFTDGRVFYETVLKLPPKRCLLFYFFEVVTDRQTYYVYPDTASTAGGETVRRELPADYPEALPTNRDGWIIAVYEREHTVPDWFKGATMYQIFPDRFSRGKDFSYEKMIEAADAPERIYHSDWTEEVDIRGKEPDGYLACDFFGGTLRGIIEKIPYIAEFGTTVIYLNPIFKARSNHRYDTGDYFTIDPMLGDLDDFRELCRTAEEYGIRVILDGVFSHTGADSIYFNRFGRYDSVGAWQEYNNGAEPSRYSEWYDIRHENGDIVYDSWWGFADLPNVMEHNLDYMDFITGENGVVRYWLRQGASGWRLDVSDELPDDFIQAIHRAAKAEKADAVVMGEVWEDAVHKFSYGHYRDFLLGSSHDSVMGYPFTTAITSWLSYRVGDKDMLNSLETIREHYPPDFFMANMNLISSHDAPRAITVLAGDEDPGDRERQISMRLDKRQRALGEKRLLLALFLQMTYPGNAALYYADEYGAEGYRDPFNRRTFRPESASGEFFETYRRICALRRQYPLLKTGQYETISAENDVFIFRRYDGEKTDGEELYVLVNRSEKRLQAHFRGRVIAMEPLSAYLYQKNIVFGLTNGSIAVYNN